MAHRLSSRTISRSRQVPGLGVHVEEISGNVFLVAMPFVTSSVLAPSSDALCS